MSKFEYIDSQKNDPAETNPVTKMCAWLAVSTSGFYHWRGRPQSRAGRRPQLLPPRTKTNLCLDHDPHTSCILGGFSSVRNAHKIVSIVVEQACPRCGQPFFVSSTRRRGRPRRWCSQACRRAGYEERRAAKNGAIAIEYVEKPAPTITLDDHVAAVLGSPAACRNVLRQLRARQGNGELNDAKWSSVSDELEGLRTPPDR